MIVNVKTYLLLITSIIFLNLINSSCSKNIVYRQSVVGVIRDIENKPLSHVHIYYDTLDILSPRNIFSGSNGQFVFPKIEVENSQESKRKIKKLSHFIFFKKIGYKIKKYDISKFNHSDTIRLGVIQLE